MSTDLSFITNEDKHTLKERFEVLIKDTDFFDCLVGYFYSSGFHAIYKSLESTKKIRILVGISTSKQTFDLMGKVDRANQQTIDFSHAETKQEVEDRIQKEMEDSEDNKRVEEGVSKFIEWIGSGKLVIKETYIFLIYVKKKGSQE